MLNLELPTVLAIGPREVISLLFVIIAFMSWVFSIINGKQNGPGGARPNPQAGGGRRPQKDLQAEINRFLNNVKGNGREDESKTTPEETRISTANVSRSAVDSASRTERIFGTRSSARWSDRSAQGARIDQSRSWSARASRRADAGASW